MKFSTIIVRNIFLVSQRFDAIKTTPIIYLFSRMHFLNCGRCVKNFQVKIVSYRVPYNFCSKHFSVSQRNADLFKKTNSNFFFEGTTPTFFGSPMLLFLKCGTYEHFQVNSQFTIFVRRIFSISTSGTPLRNF